MVDRRAFLKAGGLSLLCFGAGSLVGPRFLARAAMATPGPGPSQRRRVLVAIFQRGAMDGLAAVPPLTEEALLRRLRPRLAMSGGRAAGEDRALDLGCGFGLHPALAPFEPLWKESRLAIVHQVGSPDPTRSHFDAQDYMETGTPGRKGTASGWLNRVCGELGHEATPFRALAMTSALPRSLYGAEPAIAVARLEDFAVRLPGAERAAAAAGKGFEALYAETSQELLRAAGAETFDAIAMFREQNLRSYRPAAGVEYPRGPLGTALRQIAQLVKAEIGLEVAFAETGGWDTHVQQGAIAGGFSRRADDLARSVAAFWRDLGPHQDDVLVTTMTEFGRTVRENGSGGTDHGHGSCLFVLGNRVDGGKVHGSFAGLDPDLLYEGRDLPVTTDFRAVFSELAAGHLGVTTAEAVFPGWQGEVIPLLRRG
ncbi:MAG TPA: DUF1501 domain-containing protein [Thermoanaerobaculia bacterium]|nr:DUF1501 domain-containing protein [Thermoanaerobaculia bacterium]